MVLQRILSPVSDYTRGLGLIIQLQLVTTNNYNGLTDLHTLLITTTTTHKVLAARPLSTLRGSKQPRLWIIVVGSRSLVGQGTQLYSVL
jgi:hypothetical protein